MDKMQEVGKDIIGIKLDLNKSMVELLNEFYDVMRKHGIYLGTKEGNGVSIANFDWTMCLTLFLSRFDYEVRYHIMINDVPSDIFCKDNI